MLSVLPIAATVFTSSPPSMSIDDVERVVPPLGAAVVVVLVTVVLTALAGGTLGGLIRRRVRVTGAFLALVVAWLLGALLLPMVAATLGVDVATSVVCFDTCSPMLDSGSPTAGLLGVAIGLVIGVVSILPIAVALVLAFIAFLLVRRRHPTVAVACLALGFGVMNSLAFVLVEGTFVAYVCLAIGVIAWSRWLDARVGDPSPAADEPATAPPATWGAAR